MRGRRLLRLFTITAVAAVLLVALAPPGVGNAQTPDDCTATTATMCTLTVGGSSTGNSETTQDQDWFAAALVANKNYVVIMSGYRDLMGVYSASGDLLAATDRSDEFNGGTSFSASADDSRLNKNYQLFSTHTTGRHYIAIGLGGFLQRTGSYTVQLQEVTDDYPDNSSTTGTVTVGGSATGEIEHGLDRDWFSVSLLANTSYNVTVSGEPGASGGLSASGTPTHHPALWGIHNSEGVQQPRTTAGTRSGTDRRNGSGVIFTPTMAGTYYVSAGAYGGHYGTYTVTIAAQTGAATADDYTSDTTTSGSLSAGGSVTGTIETAGDRDWLAASLTAGRTYRFDIYGLADAKGTLRCPSIAALHDTAGDAIKDAPSEQSGGGEFSAVTFAAATTGTHHVVVAAAPPCARLAARPDTGTYAVALADVTNDLPADSSTSGSVAIGGSASGAIDYAGDRDWFSVTLVANAVYTILLAAASGEGSLTNPYFYGVAQATGEVIAGTTNDDISTSNSNSRITFTPSEAGAYYLVASGSGDATGAYDLSISTSSGSSDVGRTQSNDPVREPSRRAVVLPPLRAAGGGRPSGPTPSRADFAWTVDRDLKVLDSGNEWPTGLWSDGSMLWILENGEGADDAVYAYDLADGSRAPQREFALDETNRAPRGVWSDRATIWVSDSGQDKLFAHDLGSGERREERDIKLDTRNRAARGIWSVGETMWVLDGGKNSLFAYDLGSGELLAEYALDAANDDPRGIWSDDLTVWVSNHDPKRLFAYRLPTREEAEQAAEDAELERVRGEEFSTLSPVSNNSPRGIWSDGGVMYVADASDGKVYTYNMPDAIDARLASLTLSDVEIGEFAPGRTRYHGVVSSGVTETMVAVATAQRDATVTIVPADAEGDAEGHQVATGDGTGVTVTVTSPDGSRTKVYRVLLSEPAPSASCLRGAIDVGFSLVVSEGGTLEDLEACARSRHVTVLYTRDGRKYVPYILGAPAFVNARFVELFAGWLPPTTPLIARSDGPPEAATDRSAEGN